MLILLKIFFVILVLSLSLLISFYVYDEFVQLIDKIKNRKKGV